MKKIISIILAITLMCTLCLTMTACNEQSANTGNASQNGAKKYKIGICQLVTHEALDAASESFMQAIKDKLGEENVEFDYQNAANDQNACTTIINSFVSNKVDLIMANATPALQSAVNATLDIPILGTSITEYGVALGIDNFNGTVGGNVSGTSDLADLKAQTDAMLELFPDAENIGLLYCSAEPNSEYQVKLVEEYLKSKGVTSKRYSFTDSNDVAVVTTTAATECDALYIPTDNTAASCSETIGNVVRNEKTPVFASEAGICRGCGIATLTISYKDLGYKTGEMAVKILTGEADISTMPIEYAEASKFYNEDMCKEFGINPPAEYKPLS